MLYNGVSALLSAQSRRAFGTRGPGTLAHVALVGQGAKLTDEKAVAVQAVLCAAIGQTGHYSDNANIAQPGVVAQHVFKAYNHNSFQLSPTSRVSTRYFSHRSAPASRRRMANYAYLGIMCSIVVAYAALGYSVTTLQMSINNTIQRINSNIQDLLKIVDPKNRVESR